MNFVVVNCFFVLRYFPFHLPYVYPEFVIFLHNQTKIPALELLLIVFLIKSLWARASIVVKILLVDSSFKMGMMGLMSRPRCYLGHFMYYF